MYTKGYSAHTSKLVWYVLFSDVDIFSTLTRSGTLYDAFAVIIIVICFDDSSIVQLTLISGEMASNNKIEDRQ